MSKMMDNLARVREPEEASPARPSLFVVKEQAVRISHGGAPGPSRRKILVVWALAFFLICGLGAAFFLGKASVPFVGSDRAASPPPMAADPQGETVAMIRAGQLSAALAGLERVVAARPEQAAAALNRAYVLKELGHLGEAEKALLALAARDPGNPLVQNNLGALYLRAGRLPEAEAALRRAVNLDARAFEARVNLAVALERRRDWPAALKLFEEVLASGFAPEHNPLIRERVRRLRSLSVASQAPGERH